MRQMGVNTPSDFAASTVMETGKEFVLVAGSAATTALQHRADAANESSVFIPGAAEFNGSVIIINRFHPPPSFSNLDGSEPLLYVLSRLPESRPADAFRERVLAAAEAALSYEEET
jgi:hypothetical protein